VLNLANRIQKAEREGAQLLNVLLRSSTKLRCKGPSSAGRVCARVKLPAEGQDLGLCVRQPAAVQSESVHWRKLKDTRTRSCLPLKKGTRWDSLPPIKVKDRYGRMTDQRAYAYTIDQEMVPHMLGLEECIALCEKTDVCNTVVYESPKCIFQFCPNANITNTSVAEGVDTWTFVPAPDRIPTSVALEAGGRGAQADTCWVAKSTLTPGYRGRGHELSYSLGSSKAMDECTVFEPYGAKLRIKGTNLCMKEAYTQSHRYYPAGFVDCDPNPNSNQHSNPSENFIFYADKMCTVKYQSSSYQDYVNVNGRRTRVTVNWKTGIQEITCQKFVPLGGTPRRAPAKTCGSVPLTQCCGTFDQWLQPCVAAAPGHDFGIGTRCAAQLEKALAAVKDPHRNQGKNWKFGGAPVAPKDAPVCGAGNFSTNLLKEDAGCANPPLLDLPEVPAADCWQFTCLEALNGLNISVEACTNVASC
jgi:hypothetical protein